MENIQIFNNPEFGDIRAITINGEPWFVGNDCAKALGFKDPYSGIRKNVDEEDKQTCPVGSGAEMRNMNVINESGLYSLIFGSRLESAKKFKKWVTSEVLPSIRKTGSYGRPKSTQDQILLLAQGTVELYKKVGDVSAEVQAVKTEFQEFKETLPLMPEDADVVSDAVKKRGVSILGGKTTPAYNDRSLRMKLYCNLYANLKYSFQVSTYKAIKRNQKAAALEAIAKYEPPFFLMEQIEMANAQQSFNLGGAGE